MRLRSSDVLSKLEFGQYHPDKLAAPEVCGLEVRNRNKTAPQPLAVHTR